LDLQISASLKEKLYQNSIVKSYKAGDVIMNENSRINAIPIIAKGVLSIFRTEEDGREILLYYIQAGESCVMSFLGGLHNENFRIKASVEEDAEILFLPIDKFSLFMKEYPQWLEYIFQLYHKRFEELLEIIDAISFKKVDERLWMLLNKKREVSGKMILNVSHEQLANELGTARVVVSRLLKQLEEDGKLKLGRNKITLR
jgi:CRP/FNR family transcriptional regulator